MELLVLFAAVAVLGLLNWLGLGADSRDNANWNAGRPSRPRLDARPSATAQPDRYSGCSTIGGRSSAGVTSVMCGR